MRKGKKGTSVILRERFTARQMFVVGRNEKYREKEKKREGKKKKISSIFALSFDTLPSYEST